MKDLISRQAAIDSIHANSVYENEYNLTAKHIEDAVKQLPPVSPQKPCEDAISRELALEKMADYVASGYADSAEDFEEYSKIICQLPPVIPAEKVGRWIDDNKDEIDAQYGRHLYRCQICNKYAEYFVGGTEDWWDIEKPNYCPSCGAKMQEVEG